MSSGGPTSPVDSDPAPGRFRRRRGQIHSLSGSGDPFNSSNGVAEPTETLSRSSTPELLVLDATSISDDDPLPFPPHPSTRAAWRNLSIILEGSESTNSLSNDDNPLGDPLVVTALRSSSVDEQRRSSFSLAPSKPSKEIETKRTSLADKIAFFESATSRRPSLPNILNDPLPSSIPFPSTPSQTDDINTNLGKILHSGFLWYLNVHASGPPRWTLCKASLYQTVLRLVWKTSGTTVATVTLDLLRCLDVQSTPTVRDPSVADDVGAIAWATDTDRFSPVEDVYPMHLQFDDGVERIAASTLIDRVTWVGTILEFLPARPSRRTGPLPGTPFIERSRFLRPASHNCTRSTGDVPTSQGSVADMPLDPLKGTSSMSDVARAALSLGSESGRLSLDESSKISSVPPRRRSVSLKSVASLFSGRSSRLSKLSSTTESDPSRSAPTSPAPSRSRRRLLSRSSSRGDESIMSEHTEESSLGLSPKSREVSSSKLRKPKPRIQALARLTIDPHRSFSDGGIPEISRRKDTASLKMDPSTDHSSGSATYQTAATSLPSTPLYYTASEGDGSSHNLLPASTSTPDDSLFVTASDITSSDAWMAHFSAASRPTPPRVPPSPRGRTQSTLSSPTSRTMPSSNSLMTFFDRTSTLLPVQTADRTSQPTSARGATGSMQDVVSTVEVTAEEATSDMDQRETSVLMVDQHSDAFTNESVEQPRVPPPTTSSSPYGTLLLLDDTVSRPRSHMSSSLYVRASQPPTPNETSTYSRHTQINFTDSLPDVATEPLIFSSMTNGDVEYEVTLVRSSTPSHSTVTPRPTPVLDPRSLPLKRVIPRRAIPKRSSDISLNSNIFLPSWHPSVHTVIPNTPSFVDISLTPVEASRLLSVDDSIASLPAPDFPEEDACQERLKHLLAFIEQTRAAQTTTSGELGEQLERIERQLLDMEQLLQDRIQKEQTVDEAPEMKAFPVSGAPPGLPKPPGGFHHPVAISLSPPPSFTRDDTTITSVELQVSISNTSKSQTSAPTTGLVSEKPLSGGDTSSSLHLSRFPDVPHLARRSTHQSARRSSRTSESISNSALKTQTEKLGETIHILVTRQRTFNDALEGLQRAGSALQPIHLPSISDGNNPPEDLPSRLINLLTDLEGYTRKLDHERHDQKDDRFQEFLDLASARTSPSSVGHVEIVQARPVQFNATSISYARKIQGPRRRSESQGNVTTTVPDPSRTPNSVSVRPRSKSLGTVQVTVDETVRLNPGISSERDTLGLFLGVPHTPREDLPITRTWYRKPRQTTPRVHWDIPTESRQRGFPTRNSEAAANADLGAVGQVTSLLKRSQTQQEVASVQQDDIVRYLGELNEWLSRDAIDRRAELRDLGGRLDDIQRTLVYGAAPALSFAVPFIPLPLFTAPPEESEGFPAWRTLQDDEVSTIIPPTPPRSQRVPTTAPPPDKETIANNAPSSFVVHTESSDDEKEAIVNQELPAAPPFSTNRPTGTRVTFRSHSYDRTAELDPSHHTARPPITVLWDTATSGTRARSLVYPKVAATEQTEWKPLSTDRREFRSRSRAVKSLTPESSEIIVNIPGPSAQRAVPYPQRSLGRSQVPNHLSTGAITSLPLQTHGSVATAWDPPTATTPADLRSYRPKAKSPATRRDGSHSGPTAVTIVAPELLDARMGPNSARRQALSSRHGRKVPDYSEKGGDSGSPVGMPRQHGSHYKVAAGRKTSVAEFSTSDGGDHRVRRARSHNRSEVDDSRHHPLFKEASFTVSHPPLEVLSPSPTQVEHPPSVTTEPVTVRTHQLHGNVHDGLPPVRARPSGAFATHSIQNAHGRTTPTVTYHDDRIEPHLHIFPPTVLSDVPSTLHMQAGMPTMSPHNAVHLPVSGVDDPNVEGITSKAASQLLVVTTQPKSQISKPRGARKRPVQESSIRDGSQDVEEARNARKSVSQEVDREMLGYRAPERSRQGDKPLVANSYLNPTRSKSKQKDKRKKQTDDILSVISEKSEPRVPSPAGLDIATTCNEEIMAKKGSESEEILDSIFLGRQAERGRTIEEENQKKMLFNERLLHELRIPHIPEARRNDLGTQAPTSVHSRHVREPQFTAPTAPTQVHVKQGNRSTIFSVQPRPGTDMLDPDRRGSGVIAEDLAHNVTTVPNSITNEQKSEHASFASKLVLSPSALVGTPRSGSVIRTSGLILRSEEGRTMGTEPTSYFQELASERAKARRLEEEIQTTRAAIQALKDERAAENEKRSLDAFNAISGMQNDVQSQLQSITAQLTQIKTHGNGRMQHQDVDLLSASGGDGIPQLVNRIFEGHVAERRLKLERRSAAESQEALEAEIEYLRQQNEGQKLLIRDMLGKTTKENQRQQELLLDEFRKASAEQVKVHVDERLQEFTGVMTQEVRILLSEVGNLREQRRNLQHEIGCLLCFRNKMEPGGEFDASWDPVHGPPCTHFPASGADKDVRAVRGAPPFAGAVPAGESRPREAPAPLVSRHTDTGNHHVARPVVVSPPPAYAVPRNSRGTGTTVRPAPPPLRMPRKARGKRPD